MSELVRSCGMIFLGKGLFRLAVLMFGLVFSVGIVRGQESRKVQISFLPPPLENATYSLGVYEVKSGKLVRRLQEIAPESAFTMGLNGLITSWDGKDDAGKAVLPGRYEAHGYAIGPLKVEGVQILGNDWAADDENLRVKHVEAIGLMSSDTSLILLATMADGTVQLLRIEPTDGRVLWHHDLSTPPVSTWASPPKISAGEKDIDVEAGIATRLFWPGDGHEMGIERESDFTLAGEHNGAGQTPPQPDPEEAAGRDHTRWTVDKEGLVQTSEKGEPLRKLSVAAADPKPRAVAASETSDKLYLLEEKEGWQRVRGLSWVETKEENGKPVSTWQTFLERNIHFPDPVPGLDNAAKPVEISLVENPLVPGRAAKIKLSAGCDEKGSYLTTLDGLRLRQVGQRATLKTARLVKGKAGSSLLFYQSDGAAWDEFSIEGAKNMMAFDAGEFEMTADGEKAHSEKAAEPPDL